jgi:peptidoglycan/LPS O-acetylase OafA/YrhL
VVSQRQRIPGLDGLRAIAILSVIACHVNSEFGARLPPGHINHWISVISGAGWTGVDLFFVLSGFLITGILYRTKESENFYQNFYIRRALRIFPLFYAYAIAIMVVPVVLSATGNSALTFWAHGRRLDRLSVLAYFYNFRAASLGHHLPLVNHFWSLAVEEHFYLVWPLLVLRFRRKILMRICLAGCCGSLLLRLALMNSPRGLFAAYLLTPCRLDGLMLGAWLALASLDDAVWIKIRRSAPYVATIVAAGVLAIAVNRGHFYDFIAPGAPNDSRPVVSVGITLISLLFAATLAAVVSGSRFTRWLDTPLLRRIGLYSYGMYLYHMCVIVMLRRSNLLNGISEARSKLILCVVVAVATFAIAAVSYHVWEQPFLRLKSRYETRQQPEGAVNWSSTSDLLLLQRKIASSGAPPVASPAPSDEIVR